MEKAKILIVEDEGVIAMQIKSSLQELGYGITSIVTNGEEAIQKAELEKPDIVLTQVSPE